MELNLVVQNLNTQNFNNTLSKLVLAAFVCYIWMESPSIMIQDEFDDSWASAWWKAYDTYQLEDLPQNGISLLSFFVTKAFQNDLIYWLWVLRLLLFCFSLLVWLVFVLVSFSLQHLVLMFFCLVCFVNTWPIFVLVSLYIFDITSFIFL